MAMVEARNVELAMPVMQALERASDLRGGKLKFGIGLERWSMGERYQTLSAATTVDADMIWQATDDHDRLEYIVELSSALLASASELLKLYDRFLDPIVAKLSKGIVSLPDELLGLIFGFVAHPEEEGTYYIERLSKVSRRFRRIALGDSGLWTTLFMNQDTKMGEVERYISRSGANNDLHIVIDDNISVDENSIGEFIRTCAPAASRWTTLTLSGDWAGDWNNPDPEDGYSLVEILEQIRLHQLTLPRLQELYLTQNYPSHPGSRKIWASGSRIDASDLWTALNLRILCCTQYIPNGIFPFTSILSFSLHLTLDFQETFRQLSDLHSFLPSLANVSKIDLEIINLDDGKEIPFFGTVHLTEATLPSVTSFRLHIKDYTDAFESEMAITSFVGSFHTPLIEDFSLHLEWDLRSAYSSSEEASERLSELFDKFSPSSTKCPSLRSLSFGLAQVDTEDDAAPESIQAAKSAIVDFSLANIPQVSNLDITTCGKITFSNWRGIAEGPISSSLLREIRLRDCEDMDIEAFQQTVQSLKKLNVWDLLKSVVIQGCSSLHVSSTSVTDIDIEKISFVA